MAELLILVVIAGLALLYAADRARKLRARARQMSAMNDRLDVAAAKVDEQQERKQARVKASAELTSVMPAIKRPPLSLPGVPGPATGPEDDEPAAAEREAGPAADAAPGDTPLPAGDTPLPAGATTATAGGTPPAADAENSPDDATAEKSPAAQTAPDSGGSPAGGDSPATEDSPAAAEEAAPEPVCTAEGTRTMGRVHPDAVPAAKLQVTSDGTLIMPPVPGQGPAPAGEAGPAPVPSQARARQQSPSQEQPNRN